MLKQYVYSLSFLSIKGALLKKYCKGMVYLVVRTKLAWKLFPKYVKNIYEIKKLIFFLILWEPFGHLRINRSTAEWHLEGIYKTAFLFSYLVDMPLIFFF